MGRYYCPYCDVFLEHDSHSVIRSHLQGKNHVRLYCQYYQTICLKDPTQDPSYRPDTLSPPYQYSLSKFYAGMPGHLHKHEDSISESLELPPPPTLAKFPPPPPSHYFFDTEKRHQLTEKAAEDEYRRQHAIFVTPVDKYHHSSKFVSKNSQNTHRGGHFGRRSGFGGQPRGGPANERAFRGHQMDGYRQSTQYHPKRTSPY